MSSFVMTYCLVWLAVVLYVARLGVRQRQLWGELKSLRSMGHGPQQSVAEPVTTPTRSAA